MAFSPHMTFQVHTSSLGHTVRDLEPKVPFGSSGGVRDPYEEL